ncbi:hypothetical protein [Niallia sp. RD1]|uniref:hypothetical protein n=1 Tax=Niallia sp. RD1 TaxID=2962858 RepID=UPI000C75FB04|nr:hypothetical protein [Niallia sp. RD1]UTI42091.1 hypothetical protein NKG37_25310 [Niallia sp. RD1]
MEMYDVAIIPLILALVELLKRVGFPVKYTPVVALVLGVGFGLVYIDGDIKQSIIVGLMLGLSASGLYSGTKSVVKSDN